jgi:hypothetical protein
MALPGTAPDFYLVSGEDGVLVKRVAAGDYGEPSGPQGEWRELLQKLAGIVGGEADMTPEGLKQAVLALTHMEALAIALFDVRDVYRKQRANEAKESALGALYTGDGAYRSECVKRLRAYVTGERGKGASL